MVRNTPWRLPLLLVFLLPLACGEEGGDPAGESQPAVVASIYPVGDLVRILARDLVRVEVLLPAGASPATFDVTPRQLRDLQDGSLFLMIGAGLDEWVSELTAGYGGPTTVVRISHGIPLMAGGGHEGTGNPHVWLDPILVRDHLVPRMKEALAEVVPGMASVLDLRADLLADSLTRLDQEIRAALEPLEHRAFLSTHAAWSYFAARYGLEEAGVVHSHPGQDPSSRELAHLIDEARDHQIDCLFTEPQLGEVAVRALATELSLPTCMLDPLGGPGVEGRDGYFQLLRFNTGQFVRGLQGPGE
ncbi:MAG: metal ABC transporter substrate-binding protein [Longimicrobiales bacterium]